MGPDGGTSAPAPLRQAGSGPEVVVGHPIELVPGLLRLTAPNPSMMTGPGTNTYLIGDPAVTVLDPGPADLAAHTGAVLAAATQRGRWIERIVVTHTHPDHAPGAAALAAATGAEVVGLAPAEGFAPDRRAVHGERLTVGGDELVARHTPGHASDHVCWLLASERLLFTGDHVMEGSTVVIRPPDGDLGAYLESLEGVLADASHLSALAPGHGRLLADPAAAVADVLAHRRAREALAVGALEAGPASVDDLMAVVYPEVGPERHDVARATLWAHLRHLAATGGARCDRPITAEGADARGIWRSGTGNGG